MRSEIFTRREWTLSFSSENNCIKTKKKMMKREGLPNVIVY